MTWTPRHGNEDPLAVERGYSLSPLMRPEAVHLMTDDGAGFPAVSARRRP